MTRIITLKLDEFSRIKNDINFNFNFNYNVNFRLEGKTGKGE